MVQWTRACVFFGAIAASLAGCMAVDATDEPFAADLVSDYTPDSELGEAVEIDEATLMLEAEMNAATNPEMSWLGEAELAGDIEIMSLKTPEEAELAACALEVVEPCFAEAAICAVRCCDGALFKTAQLCGNCLDWAWGVCFDHGTRKRVRWECPCAGAGCTEC